MKPRFVATIVIYVATICMASCHSREPIVVNVLRDVKSQSFPITEHKLLKFQSTRPKSTSGRRIIIQSILLNSSRFEHTLSDDRILHTMKPDLVILDSRGQTALNPALRTYASTAHNACGTELDCPAFIPGWVVGEKLDASQQVLKALLSTK